MSGARASRRTFLSLLATAPIAAMAPWRPTLQVAAPAMLDSYHVVFSDFLDRPVKWMYLRPALDANAERTLNVQRINEAIADDMGLSRELFKPTPRMELRAGLAGIDEKPRPRYIRGNYTGTGAPGCIVRPTDVQFSDDGIEWRDEE